MNDDDKERRASTAGEMPDQRGARTVAHQRNDMGSHHFAEGMVGGEVTAEHRFEIEKAVGDRAGISLRIANDLAKRGGERVLHIDAFATFVGTGGIADPRCNRERQVSPRRTGTHPVTHGAKQSLRQFL